MIPVSVDIEQSLLNMAIEMQNDTRNADELSGTIVVTYRITFRAQDEQNIKIEASAEKEYGDMRTKGSSMYNVWNEFLRRAGWQRRNDAVLITRPPSMQGGTSEDEYK